MSTSEKYPASALRFTGELEFQENENENESPQVKMLARSGKPIEHWFWGTIVHDNDGAKFNDSIPIDYCHDDKEIIGFATRENISVDQESNLVATATITPFQDDDRASEILAKAKQGVPYQASINFAGEGIKLEKIKDGQTVQVNGYQFNGPGVVVREWPLRGVAVCPYGADSNTKSEFLSDDLVSVTVLEHPKMSETKNSDAVEDPKQDTASVEAPAEAAVLAVDPRAEAKKFVKAFGAEKGGQYFADELSFEEGLAKFAADLKDENERLKAELKNARETSSVAVPAADETPAKIRNGFSSRLKVPGFDAANN